MQFHTQPIQNLRKRAAVQRTPAGIPTGLQAQGGSPSKLSFDDMRIDYASDGKQYPGHNRAQHAQCPAAAQLRARTGQDVVQLLDESLKRTNYLHASDTVLGRAARRMTAANRNPANRRNSHSEILRASLVQDAGVIDPAQSGITNQAHHIVETSNRHGQELLRRYGIEPDSAVNGVLLPTYETDDTGRASTHLGSHSAAYTRAINAALNKAVSDARAAAPRGQQRKKILERIAVIRKLQRIRIALLKKNIPLNASSDATFNPATNSKETVEDIFRRETLI